LAQLQNLNTRLVYKIAQLLTKTEKNAENFRSCFGK
jgi:hypothetical protein